MMIGYHFAANHLRNGEPLPTAGTTLKHRRKLVPCKAGFHFSVRAIDALAYAPGAYVAKVEAGGEIIAHGIPVDKYVARTRTNLTDYMNVSDLLLAFARQCALDVIELWRPSPIARRYLETGLPEIREEAHVNAYNAVFSETHSWSMHAARAAVRATAQDIGLYPEVAAETAAFCAAEAIAEHVMNLDLKANHRAKQNKRLETMLSHRLDS